MRYAVFSVIVVLALLSFDRPVGSAARYTGQHWGQFPDALVAASALASSNSDSCLVELTGDVNMDGTITSSDIIYLVNYVFLHGGPPPQPCLASGDVNCNGSIRSDDIIYLVNYSFKSGPAPCDVCTLIPGYYSCP